MNNPSLEKQGKVIWLSGFLAAEGGGTRTLRLKEMNLNIGIGNSG